jgi:hypothetical protein
VILRKMSEDTGMGDMALYRRHVAIQTALAFIAAAALVVIHPPPAWVFVAVVALGVSWGFLTHIQLRAEDRARNERDAG